ncbi:MAG: 1-(5-phosphoribosyl)-5-[(5-phosphoribosylamino)methylideneamino]imidazole-4-carboxamide isomerase [bacterium]
MIILPAIDLRNGKCVRLLQGRLEDETVFADDPVEMARRWQENGAEYLHLVDLDGAFQGAPVHLPVVQKIKEATGLPVELGGGIRDMETIAKVLDSGVDRVILGTVAVSNPKLLASACAEFGERIVLGLDARDGKVAIKGWVDVTEKSAVELACELKEKGVCRIIFTDISRDGMLSGPNLKSIEELASKTGIPVIASGGVNVLADIVNLKKIAGVEGVITGKALYTGSLNLSEAIQAARRD